MRSHATTASTLVLPDLLQGQWASAVITTFSADLAFFNARLVSQLAQVPLRMILADGERLTQRLHEAATTGQRLRMTNRSYLVTPIRHTSAAHAKVILLLAQREGLLAVGSGNLGQDGYASPGELWHIYRYHDDRPQHLAEFVSVRSLIDGLTARSLLDPPAVELLQAVLSTAPWLPQTHPPPAAAVRHNLDRPLLEQLAEMVDWPVQELVVHAPFHDPDCSALATLIETFSPMKVTALVSKDTAVDPSRLHSVVASARQSAIEAIEVAAEPETYLHAKWVHLQGTSREALLTGSANLSRSALLRPATDGNIEVGVLTTAAAGGFAFLYDHLRRTPIDSLEPLSLSIPQNQPPPAPPDQPVVLWSRLDRNRLTIMFDRPVGELPVAIKIADTALDWSRIRIDGHVVEFDLDEPSATRVADGGPLTIEVGDGRVEPSYTWPYQIETIRHRLDKAGRRDYLPTIADLPDSDGELFALLQELEATLIFDPVSAWRVAKPGTEPAAPDENVDAVSWDQLDWGRVRRDPRYTGYLGHNLSAGSAPTDIQVILAAISGRLGELAATPTSTTPTHDDEDQLAREGDTDLSADDETGQDEREDELTRRALPVSTRTRMAFNRFVKRYVAAAQDEGFTDELGPIPAVVNAAIFNHLLVRLIERDAVDPTCAADAQVALWRLLWGAPDRGGLLTRLDPAERSAVDKTLADSHVRETTLRALARSHDLNLAQATKRAVRDQARHLIVNQDFGLDGLLISATETRPELAVDLLKLLLEVACWSTERELNELVVGPLGLTNADVEWRQHKVSRLTATGHTELLTDVLVVHTMVAVLTPAAIHQALERLAVASYLGGWNTGGYLRIRFEGNGRDVGFWDAEGGPAVVQVDGEANEFDTFEPSWPQWLLHLEELQEASAPRGTSGH